MLQASEFKHQGVRCRVSGFTLSGFGNPETLFRVSGSVRVDLRRIMALWLLRVTTVSCSSSSAFAWCCRICEKGVGSVSRARALSLSSALSQCLPFSESPSLAAAPSCLRVTTVSCSSSSAFAWCCRICEDGCMALILASQDIVSGSASFSVSFSQSVSVWLCVVLPDLQTHSPTLSTM